MLRNSDKVRKLLKSIETGDPAGVAVVNEAAYIQHNPQTHEGSEGLAALFARLSKTGPRVNVVRAFDDGPFVFAHTEYDFSTRRIGFEVFRFHDGLAVEHWDNIQPRLGPNGAGHSMVDGATQCSEEAIGDTERSRRAARTFVEQVLIGNQWQQMNALTAGDALIQHDPRIDADGAIAWRAALQLPEGDAHNVRYAQLHRVLAQGDFALAVCEGEFGGKHAALYHMFRFNGDGKIAEHWDTIEHVAPRSEWRNNNGKF